MRYKIHVIFILSIFLITISCNEDEKTDITLNFRLLYDGEPLVMLDDYVYPDGKNIQFTRVSFYISAVNLSSKSGGRLLTDVEIINLSQSHQTKEGALAGESLVFENFNTGPIDSIEFFVGVYQNLNATVPADYSSGHPLANSAEYWIGWDSFIFTKLEGSIDIDDDGIMETNFALHIGSDQAIQFNSLPTKDPESSTLSFELDVKNIFENSEIYDIEQHPQIHSLNQIDKALFLIENLSNNLILK